MRAVHRSGWVQCAPNATVDGHPWQECSDGAGPGVFSFALLLNGVAVLSPPRWDALPSTCIAPTRGDGDIVCDANLTLSRADVLTPTWYDPLLGATSAADNNGTHHIDLYGWRQGIVLHTCTAVVVTHHRLALCSRAPTAAVCRCLQLLSWSTARRSHAWRSPPTPSLGTTSSWSVSCAPTQFRCRCVVAPDCG